MLSASVLALLPLALSCTIEPTVEERKWDDSSYFKQDEYRSLKATSVYAIMRDKKVRSCEICVPVGSYFIRVVPCRQDQERIMYV